MARVSSSMMGPSSWLNHDVSMQKTAQDAFDDDDGFSSDSESSYFEQLSRTSSPAVWTITSSHVRMKGNQVRCKPSPLGRRKQRRYENDFFFACSRSENPTLARLESKENLQTLAEENGVESCSPFARLLKETPSEDLESFVEGEELSQNVRSGLTSTKALKVDLSTLVRMRGLVSSVENQLQSKAMSENNAVQVDIEVKSSFERYVLHCIAHVYGGHCKRIMEMSPVTSPRALHFVRLTVPKMSLQQCNLSSILNEMTE